MTRIKFLFAAALVAAVVAVTPAARAQEQACLNSVNSPNCNAHVVGGGSSAQFLSAGIGADALALSVTSTANGTGVGVPNTTANASNPNNCATTGAANAVYHWSASNGAEVVDNRDSRILPEVGNVWIVWLAACSDNTGNTGVTDIWTDVSIDSTVGNRVFFAMQKGAAVGGAQFVVLSTAGTTGGNKIPAGLMPDGTADVALPANIPLALGNTSAGGLFINVGLTDIRPEDAYAATTRAMTALNTSTYKGLGYIGATSNIGAPIQSALSGSTAQATPVKFQLSGGTDPISKVSPVRASVTIPLGAAPIVFAINRGSGYTSASGTTYPVDLATGIAPDSHVTGQKYPLANLFDGTTACNTSNAAIGWSNGVPTTNVGLQLAIREPLSGTMNTTEFNLFRSFGNTNDSQEVGVINPFNKPYNPLNLACATGSPTGNRVRGIGTGEIVKWIGNNANTMGYFFWGFANVGGSPALNTASFNYLTLDGIDPLFSAPGAYSTCSGGTAPNNDGAICGSNSDCFATGAGTAGTCSGAASPNQQFPVCNSPLPGQCSSELWPGGVTFPNLRNGKYKAWSIYRWVVEDANDHGDVLGPAHLAAAAQNAIDSSVADYVPFSTSTDGLTVFRSHYKQTTLPATTDNNGPQSAFGQSCGGTNGTVTEVGGDVGGLVYGPFGINSPDTFGYVTVATTAATNGFYKVTWKQGAKFTAGTAWEGSAITIDGTAQTVASCKTCKPTATTLYISNPSPVGIATQEVSYSAPFSHTWPSQTGTTCSASALSKHQ